MTIILNAEQQMLHDMVARFFAEKYDFDTRRKIVKIGGTWRPDIWNEMAELGLLMAGLPEHLGGLGGGAIEHMIIMEQIGSALVLEPYLETAVMGGSLLAHVDPKQADELAAGIASGKTRLAVAQSEAHSRYNLAAVATRAVAADGGYVINGTKTVVIGAVNATLLLVTARTARGVRDETGVSLFLIPADWPGIERRDYALIDGHGASDLMLQNVAVPASALVGEAGKGLPIITALIDAAIVAICAESIGIMKRMLADTVAYTKERKQFGQPIAQFQVLKHRMVDMLIEVEEAVSMTHMATLSLSLPDANFSGAVSAAKVKVAHASRFVGQSAIQLHGAIGTSEELAVSHYFKRLTLLERQFGTLDHHLERFAGQIAGPSGHSSLQQDAA